MKKLLKSTLAVLLSLAMLLSCAAFAFAADEKIPIILIPGFGQSQTTVYDENGDYLGDVSVFDLPNLDIKSIVFDLIIPALQSAIARKDVDLSTAVKDEMATIFQPFLKNDDGSYKYTTVIREFNAPYSKLSLEDRLEVDSHVSMDSFSSYNDVRYYFTYDSFGSIRTAATRLHDYLHNVVLPQTGASKAIFVPISQGGTVFQEYLELFPEDYAHIKKVVSMIPAYDGSVIVGDVLTDNVNIYDQKYLHETILPSLLGSTDTAYAISLLLRLGLSEKTTIAVEKAALAAALDCLVTRSSIMWALCPAASYAAAEERLLSNPALSAVKAEVDEYAQARSNFTSHIAALQNDGVVFHNVVAYDIGLMFGTLFGSNGVDADDLLAPSSPSLGATAAPLDGTLGKDYVSPATYCSNPEHNHISPDGKIDASTGFLPENTWYFKGVSHTSMNSRNDIKTFAVNLIIDDSITDIYSTDIYSQFTDPSTLVASKTTIGNITYYYDAEGNLMYYKYGVSDDDAGSSQDSSSSKFSFVKLFYDFVNFIFRLLNHMGIKIKQL